MWSCVEVCWGTVRRTIGYSEITSYVGWFHSFDDFQRLNMDLTMAWWISRWITEWYSHYIVISQHGNQYGQLVIGCLRSHGILCIGLYRLMYTLRTQQHIPKQSIRSPHRQKRFVITNPPSDFQLQPSDKVIKPYSSICIYRFKPSFAVECR